MTIPWCRAELPYLTTDQMILVDRAMTEDYGIELIQMMENAGRALAALARQRFLVSTTIGDMSCWSVCCVGYVYMLLLFC